MEQRILYLDFLRAIATFAVIMLHVSATGIADSSILPSAEWEITNIYYGLTPFCVPIFVMISGSLFLNPAKPITIKDVYLKYVARIVCAFIFWSLAHELYYLIVFDKPIRIGSIVYGHIHFWFLFMICGLYIVTPLLRCITKYRTMAIYFVTIALIFTFLIPCIQNITTNIFPGTTEAIEYIDSRLTDLSISIISGFSAYFILGHLLHTTIIEHPRIFYLAGVISTLTVIILTHHISHKHGTPILFLFNFSNIFTLIASTAIFIWAKNNISSISLNPALQKIILSVSKKSFGIYLVHMLVLYSLRNIGIDYSITNPILSIPLVSIAIFIISYAISFLVHKIPYLRNIS